MGLVKTVRWKQSSFKNVFYDDLYLTSYPHNRITLGNKIISSGNGNIKLRHICHVLPYHTCILVSNEVVVLLAKCACDPFSWIKISILIQFILAQIGAGYEFQILI